MCSDWLPLVLDWKKSQQIVMFGPEKNKLCDITNMEIEKQFWQLRSNIWGFSSQRLQCTLIYYWLEQCRRPSGNDGFWEVVPWAEIGGSNAAERGNEQFCGFVCSTAHLALDTVRTIRWSRGSRMRLVVQFVLCFGWGASTAAPNGWTGAPQSIELPKLIAQKVSQGRAAHRAVQAGQEQVPARPWCRGEVVIIIRVTAGFYDRRKLALC